MDLLEDTVLQVNSAIKSYDGPLLFILILEGTVASGCLQYTGEENFINKLKLFSWKPGDLVGMLLVDPQIYDYDDLILEVQRKDIKILSTFHYFPETPKLLQFQGDVQYPVKLINNDVEIQEEPTDLMLLQSQLKERIDRMIFYLESVDLPSDLISQEIYLLLLRYQRKSPNLLTKMSDLEKDIVMIQTMFIQLETNMELD